MLSVCLRRRDRLFACWFVVCDGAVVDRTVSTWQYVSVAPKRAVKFMSTSDDLAIEVKEDCGNCTQSPTASAMSVVGKETNGIWVHFHMY